MNFARTAGFGGGAAPSSAAAVGVPNTRHALCAKRLVRFFRRWAAIRRGCLELLDSSREVAVTDAAWVALGWARLRWAVFRGRVHRGATRDVALPRILAVVRRALEDTIDPSQAQQQAPKVTATVVQLLARGSWNKGRLADTMGQLHEAILKLLAEHDMIIAQLTAAAKPTAVASELRVMMVAVQQRYLTPDSFPDFSPASTSAKPALKVMRILFSKTLVAGVAKALVLGRANGGSAWTALDALEAASKRHRSVPAATALTAASRLAPAVVRLVDAIDAAVVRSAPFAGVGYRWLRQVDFSTAVVVATVATAASRSTTLLSLFLGSAHGAHFLWAGVGAALDAACCLTASPSVDTPEFGLLLRNVCSVGAALPHEALVSAGLALRTPPLTPTLGTAWATVATAAGGDGANERASLWLSAVVGLCRSASRHDALFVSTLHRQAADGPIVSALSAVLKPSVLTAIFGRCGEDTSTPTPPPPPPTSALASPPSPTTGSSASLFKRIRRARVNRAVTVRARPVVNAALIAESYAAPPWLVVLKTLSLVAGRGRHPLLLNQFLTAGAEQYRRLWAELSSPEFAALLDYAFQSHVAGTPGTVASDLCDALSFLYMLFSHAFAVLGDEEWQTSNLPFDPHADSRLVVQLGTSFVLRAAAIAVITPTRRFAESSIDEASNNIRQCLRMMVDRSTRVPMGGPSVSSKRRAGDVEGLTVAESAASSGAWWALDVDGTRDLESVLNALGQLPQPHQVKADDAGTVTVDPTALGTLWQLTQYLQADKADALSKRARTAATPEERAAEDERSLAAATHPFTRAVMALVPHSLPFSLRAEFMRCVFSRDRRLRQVDRVKLGLRIRRSHILQDAYQQVMRLEDVQMLRARFHIEFVDAHGQVEAGIDAGGVFKEFMDLVIRKAFDPNLGLFQTIAGRDEAYPNPHAERLYGAEWKLAFRFVGRMLAKVLYEGVQVPIRLAPFAANALLGRGWSVDDLRVLDAGLWSSLTKLKEMEDCSVTALAFTDEDTVLGETIEHELVPGGANMEVTNDNLVRYIHLLAHHRLHGRTSGATAALVEGIKDVFDMSVLRCFSAVELQQALSGGQSALDVADLARHAKYVKYERSDRTIKLLWEVVSEMSDEDKGRFLAFCTGSSRPPLLGFDAVTPPFTVAKADTGSGDGQGSLLNIVVDIDRLPTASTCFNLLKLPPYLSKSNLREKLLQAIRSDSGFGLS